MGDDEEIEVNETEIAALSRKLIQVKAELEALEKERKAIQAELVTTLMGSDRDEITVDDDTTGGTLRVKVVAPEKTVIDEMRLRRKLGAAAWKKVTTLVLDRAKLEAEVTTGGIDIKTVAECSHLAPITPYITVKRGK